MRPSPYNRRRFVDLEGQTDERLAAFHRGERSALGACYADHFDAVDRAIGAILGGADRETVIHEVFSRLLASEELRLSFRGGSLGAWLTVVARNAAIDYRRRLSRERELAPEAGGDGGAAWEATQARMLVDQFRRQVLRPEWAPVFELCFVQQLSQRDAARELGMSRTTLAYRSLRIERALRHFLLEGEA